MGVSLQLAPAGAAALGCEAHRRRSSTICGSRRFSLTSSLLLLLFLVSLGSCQGDGPTWQVNGPATGLSKNAADWVSVGSEIANFNQPTVTYNDSKLGLVCWQKFDFDTWTILGKPGIHTGVSKYTKMVLDSVGRHIVGYRGNSRSITVMEFKPGEELGAGTWAPMGASRFTGSASYLDMAVGFLSDGGEVISEVFIVYRDEAKIVGNNKASVMSFVIGTSTKWSFVGKRAFTPGAVVETRIVAGTTGDRSVVSVAAIEPAFNRRVSMWQLSPNRKSWVRQGAPGGPFAGKAAGLRLALTTSLPADKPWIACMDVTNSAKPVVAVSRWSASKKTWQKQPNAGFVFPAARFMTLGIFEQNVYVLYADATVKGKATMKKLVSGKWRIVGKAGFSKGVASWVDLAFNRNGVPVMGMSDAGNKNKATIMEFIE